MFSFRYRMFVHGVDFPSIPVSVGIPQSIPPSVVLEHNYPNPFNGLTRLGFTMPFRGEAILTVFDALGKTVAVPFNGLAGPGYHGLFWDAGTIGLVFS